ncbi:MAG: V-type ATP synthase subunit D [Deltaproteobacteria bacterium]|nr:V-type ATP synthase subunit D [Deltaproteobacteria bacterium]
MAKRINLTRPELKRQRDILARFQRYLPMLKLKQQLLQVGLRDTDTRIEQIKEKYSALENIFSSYVQVLNEPAGVPFNQLATPSQVNVGNENIAGVEVPVYEGVRFDEAQYSLFATPPWLDRALADRRSLTELNSELEVLRMRRAVLARELARALQRVNLFEKVRIPEALEAIRRIRIQLGDEMSAAVGRAKIAKERLISSV